MHHCVNCLSPLLPHSLTKLRIKINLNTLEIKLVLNHRPIAPESFQRREDINTLSILKYPGEIPDIAWGF